MSITTSSRRSGTASRTRLTAALSLALAAGCSGAHGTEALPGVPARPVSVENFRVAPVADILPNPSGTLYMGASDGNVYAFPLNSSGAVVPSRTITPHPNQFASQNINSFATLADGKLAILQQTFGNPNRCRVVVESATANGSPAAQNYHCDANTATWTVPTGIARNAVGGYDLLYSDNTAQNLMLKRFSADGATPYNVMLPISNVVAMATDAGGHDYLLSSNGELRKYKAATINGAVTQADFVIPGTSFRAMAVAPDKTIYVAYGDLGNEMIVAVVNNVVTRTLGPFTKYSITSLAVDSLGELYAGLAGTLGLPPTIRVYSPTANQSAAIRVITPAVNAPCACGIAISE